MISRHTTFKTHDPAPSRTTMKKATTQPCMSSPPSPYKYMSAIVSCNHQRSPIHDPSHVHPVLALAHQHNMINTKKLVEMAKRWRTAAAMGRKRISSTGAPEADAMVADKGHFILYTSEGKRFMVPLAFLKTSVFEELLRMAEEEFGLPRDGPITLPCNAPFLEHVLSLLRRRGRRDSDAEELMVSNCMRHSLTSPHGDAGHSGGVVVC